MCSSCITNFPHAARTQLRVKHVVRCSSIDPCLGWVQLTRGSCSHAWHARSVHRWICMDPMSVRGGRPETCNCRTRVPRWAHGSVPCSEVRLRSRGGCYEDDPGGAPQPCAAQDCSMQYAPPRSRRVARKNEVLEDRAQRSRRGGRRSPPPLRSPPMRSRNGRRCSLGRSRKRSRNCERRCAGSFWKRR